MLHVDLVSTCVCGVIPRGDCSLCPSLSACSLCPSLSTQLYPMLEAASSVALSLNCAYPGTM